MHSPAKSGVPLFHTPRNGLQTQQVQGLGVGKTDPQLQRILQVQNPVKQVYTEGGAGGF